MINLKKVFHMSLFLWVRGLKDSQRDDCFWTFWVLFNFLILVFYCAPQINLYLGSAPFGPIYLIWLSREEKKLITSLHLFLMKQKPKRAWFIISTCMILVLKWLYSEAHLHIFPFSFLFSFWFWFFFWWIGT